MEEEGIKKKRKKERKKERETEGRWKNYEENKEKTVSESKKKQSTHVVKRRRRQLANTIKTSVVFPGFFPFLGRGRDVTVEEGGLCYHPQARYGLKGARLDPARF